LIASPTEPHVDSTRATNLQVDGNCDRLQAAIRWRLREANGHFHLLHVGLRSAMPFPTEYRGAFVVRDARAHACGHRTDGNAF
jgi:hypothetical protein